MFIKSNKKWLKVRSDILLFSNNNFKKLRIKRKNYHRIVPPKIWPVLFYLKLQNLILNKKRTYLLLDDDFSFKLTRDENDQRNQESSITKGELL